MTAAWPGPDESACLLTPRLAFGNTAPDPVRTDIKRLLLALALLFATCVAEATSLRVLFIGNSYTSVNDLPAIFKQIAASAGNNAPAIEAATPGGKTLEQHSKLPDTLAKIDQGNWDVVVVQGQSLEAAISEVDNNVRTQFLGGAQALFGRIKASSPKARIILYETWARHADCWKDGKAQPGIGKDPAEMQARIRKWYQHAAAQTEGCVVAPVGDAWESNYQNSAAVRLHVKDNSHPAFNGSYLAALVLYATIYQPAALNVRYAGGLDAEEAAYLRQLAAQAVSQKGKGRGEKLKRQIGKAEIRDDRTTDCGTGKGMQKAKG